MNFYLEFDKNKKAYKVFEVFCKDKDKKTLNNVIRRLSNNELN